MSETTREEAIKIMSAIIKDVKFAMVTTTNDAGHLHSRPFTTQEKEYDGDLWFIVGKDSDAVHDISARPQVNVSFSNPDTKSYLSITGTAELSEDRAKLDEFWSDFYKVYFPQGKEDPNVQLLKISAHGAEFWESDGKLKGLFQLAKGLVGAQQADTGTSGTIKL